MTKNLRRLTTSFGLFCLIALGSATAARATTFTFTGTPPGGSGPISATADITQTGSLITITLTNNTANIQDVSQSITDFKFSINGVSLTGFTVHGIWSAINVAAGGSFTEVGGSAAADLITGAGGGAWHQLGLVFFLNALGMDSAVCDSRSPNQPTFTQCEWFDSRYSTAIFLLIKQRLSSPSWRGTRPI